MHLGQEQRTKIEFTQIGVPSADVKAKSGGWKEHYWSRLKAELESTGLR